MMAPTATQALRTPPPHPLVTYIPITGAWTCPTPTPHPQTQRDTTTPSPATVPLKNHSQPIQLHPKNQDRQFPTYQGCPLRVQIMRIKSLQKDAKRKPDKKAPLRIVIQPIYILITSRPHHLIISSMEELENVLWRLLL